MPYPTPEQILNPPIRFRPDTINLLLNWNYRHQPREEDIIELIDGLCDLYGRPCAGVTFQGPSRHVISEQRIYLDKPSVVTALHELAHHLFGPSERRACRWSVQLYKTAWPLKFKQLSFRGHLLVKK